MLDMKFKLYIFNVFIVLLKPNLKGFSYYTLELCFQLTIVN
jgi:hypothetical protein